MKHAAIWSSKYRLVWTLCIPAALAIVFHLWGEVPLGWMLFCFLVALPAVGLFATIPDFFPGGWDNPDGTVPPPWLFREFWGEFLLRLSLSGMGFAIDDELNTRLAAIFMTLAVAGSVTGLALIRTGKYLPGLRIDAQTNSASSSRVLALVVAPFVILPTIVMYLFFDQRGWSAADAAFEAVLVLICVYVVLTVVNPRPRMVRAARWLFVAGTIVVVTFSVVQAFIS